MREGEKDKEKGRKKERNHFKLQLMVLILNVIKIHVLNVRMSSRQSKFSRKVEEFLFL